MSKKMVTYPNSMPETPEDSKDLTIGQWVKVGWNDSEPMWLVANHFPNRKNPTAYFKAINPLSGEIDIDVNRDQVIALGPMVQTPE